MKKNDNRRNRKILAPLATLVVAGAIVVGSGASFTSESVNPGNMYATGTLTQTNSLANEAIFNMENLKPGDAIDGQVTITNDGSLPAVFTLNELEAVNGFADPANLTMVVTDVTATEPVEIFAGQFATMPATVLGTFEADEARTYEFVVTLNALAENAEQGKTATATYKWDAIQTEGDTGNVPVTTVQP